MRTAKGPAAGLGSAILVALGAWLAAGCGGTPTSPPRPLASGPTAEDGGAGSMGELTALRFDPAAPAADATAELARALRAAGEARADCALVFGADDAAPPSARRVRLEWAAGSLSGWVHCGVDGLGGVFRRRTPQAVLVFLEWDGRRMLGSHPSGGGPEPTAASGGAPRWSAADAYGLLTGASAGSTEALLVGVRAELRSLRGVAWVLAR